MWVRPLASGRHVFPLRIFLPPLHRNLSLEESDKDILFRTECYRVSNILHMVQVRGSVFISIYSKKKILLYRPSEKLICESSSMSLGVI